MSKEHRKKSAYEQHKTVNLPASSIHPFLWNETRTESGTTRSLGVRTPLKITLGGSFLPSAATANVTVKLLFSAPQDFTGTVRLPLNSRVRLEGISNRTGVSSILKILNKRYPWRWRAAITNRWNFTVCSSRSFGRRRARVASFGEWWNGAASSLCTSLQILWMRDHRRILSPSNATSVHRQEFLKRRKDRTDKQWY